MSGELFTEDDESAFGTVRLKQSVRYTYESDARWQDGPKDDHALRAWFLSMGGDSRAACLARGNELRAFRAKLSRAEHVEANLWRWPSRKRPDGSFIFRYVVGPLDPRLLEHWLETRRGEEFPGAHDAARLPVRCLDPSVAPWFVERGES